MTYKYWVDTVVDEVLKRVENNEILKKVVEKNGFIIYDEKTPSGRIHIGSARGWVIHDIIAKSFREKGLKGRFILSSDDMDPFDSVPPTLPKEKFKEYLGMPLRNVPSPEKGYESYAKYFFDECVNLFDKWNIEAEIESTGERYIKGDFNWAIEKVLNENEKIKEIFLETYKKTVAIEKLQFNPICENCGKIATTLAYEWDNENKLVKYICKENAVDYTKGCGFKGEISPFDGNGKLPWKVEWAAKWPTVGVVVETGGKDHFTKGGARTIAVKISCRVFNYPPPWPSTCENEGKGYEFFLMEGKKMSTSKGIGISFVEVSNLLPIQILRFLMVKTRPETTVNFKLENLPLFYREFEKYERIYFGMENVDEREKINSKRVYELSYIGKIPEKKPFRIDFELACLLIQILPKENLIDSTIKMLNLNLTDYEIEILKETFKYAEIWLNNFAPDNFKIKKVKIFDKSRLTQNQILALKEFAKRNLDFNEIKDICSKFDLSVEEFFKSIYYILIGEESGPRLRTLIEAFGKDYVLNVINKL